MKRIIKFKDENENNAYIEIEVKNGKLSMSGSCNGSAGQCRDSIKPKNDEQKQLIDIWKQWHLNDMNAGTVKQTEALKDFKGDYTAQCEYLKSVGLYDDDGYKYGTAWLKRGLPEIYRS